MRGPRPRGPLMGPSFRPRIRPGQPRHPGYDFVDEDDEDEEYERDSGPNTDEEDAVLNSDNLTPGQREWIAGYVELGRRRRMRNGPNTRDRRPGDRFGMGGAGGQQGGLGRWGNEDQRGGLGQWGPSMPGRQEGFGLPNPYAISRDPDSELDGELPNRPGGIFGPRGGPGIFGRGGRRGGRVGMGIGRYPRGGRSSSIDGSDDEDYISDDEDRAYGRPPRGVRLGGRRGHGGYGRRIPEDEDASW